MSLWFSVIDQNTNDSEVWILSNSCLFQFSQWPLLQRFSVQSGNLIVAALYLIICWLLTFITVIRHFSLPNSIIPLTVALITWINIGVIKRCQCKFCTLCQYNFYWLKFYIVFHIEHAAQCFNDDYLLYCLTNWFLLGII